MVVGRGQLAKVFKSFMNVNNIVIFASGVADSNCQEKDEFQREKKLLLKVLDENPDVKFVYFSSCALSAKEYPKNSYYRHKEEMENIIKSRCNNYYIFRIPQLFGELKTHKTLINFLYESIKNEHNFQVYSEAYRYVIEIEDVRKIVETYLMSAHKNITVDIANSYRYKVLDIVNILENLLEKQARYELVDKEDKYILNLSEILNFIDIHNLNIDFGKKYLLQHLKDKIEKD